MFSRYSSSKILLIIRHIGMVGWGLWLGVAKWLGLAGVAGGGFGWRGRWWVWLSWPVEVASLVARRGEFPRWWRGVGSFLAGGEALGAW